MLKRLTQTLAWFIGLSMMIPLSHAAVDKSVVPKYIDDVLEEWNLNEDLSQLVSMTMDPKEKYIGLLFKDEKNVYRVYKDGKLLLTKKSTYTGDPNFFSMTDDGHLLYYIDPYQLYVDDKRISSTENDYAYTVGLNLHDVYNRGRVVFIDRQNIREYNVKTQRSSILYKLDGRISYLRRNDNDYYYSVEQTLPRYGYYIYRNDKRLTKIATSQPENFQVSSKGDVYFFAQGAEYYVLYKNEKSLRSDVGRGGFIYFDEKGNVFDVVVQGRADSPRLTVGFFRNNKPVRMGTVYNMEGFLASSGVKYATRVQTRRDDTDSFMLLKNGRILGESFGFGEYRDFTGIQFGPGSKTYMRNWNDGQWFVYEDGKRILPTTFENAFFINASKNSVSIYGTRP